jgi:hypothetical protein
MMKKLIILSIMGLVLALPIKAQDLSMGVRAGFSRNSISSDFATLSSTDAVTGLTLGAYMKFKVLGFFMMPEINYNQRGNDIKGFGTNTTHNIDVPVLFGKQFFKVIRVNGGPDFQFQLANSQTQTQTQLNNYINQSKFNDFVLGLQLGVGLDVWKFSLDARYDMNLSEAGKVVYMDKLTQLIVQQYSSRANMFVFTLGYRLFQLP